MGERLLDAVVRTDSGLILDTDVVERLSSLGLAVGVTVFCVSRSVDSSVCNIVICVAVGTTDDVVEIGTAEAVPPTDGDLVL